MLAEFHETLWISGIIQLPISGSSKQNGVYQRGGSCARSSSNSKWGTLTSELSPMIIYHYHHPSQNKSLANL